MRLVAVATPPILIIGGFFSIISPEGTADQSAVVLQEQETEMDSKPSVPVTSKAPSETYPITVVKTGLDFQYTYEGALQVYSDKTVVQATWTPQCGETASVDYQTQRFTYTFSPDSSQMETKNEYSDCFGKEGIRTQSDPFQLDSDGTIRVDLIEPSDGSLIREDFIVITGGPALDAAAVEANSVDVSYSEPKETIYEAEPYDIGELGGGGLNDLAQYSTCAEFNGAGLGNFTPDHPSYSSKRDRDKDDIACEF